MSTERLGTPSADIPNAVAVQRRTFKVVILAPDEGTADTRFNYIEGIRDSIAMAGIIPDEAVVSSVREQRR